MVLPTTETSILILLALSMLMLGSWASTLKAGKKLRFELYYIDFGIGCVIAALLAAFTAGSWIDNELTFQDNYLLTGYRNMAWALVAGGIVNLGNLLLLGSMTVSGMVVAFSVAFAAAWAVDSIRMYLVNPGLSITVAASGALIMVIVIGLSAYAYALFLDELYEKKIKALNADPRTTKKRPPRQVGPLKGVALAIAAGLLYGGFIPAVENAMATDAGISGYGVMVLLAPAMLGSSILYLVFFMNFPVAGQPMTPAGYLKLSGGQHLLGLAGGALWSLGILLMLIVWDVEGVSVDAMTEYALSRGAPVLAVLLGLFLWREFSGASMRIRMIRIAAMVLLAAGIVLIATLPASVS